MPEVYPHTTRDWLEKLVSFDTTSVKSNLPLIYYVRDYLASLGIESHLVTYEEGNKGNLFATLPSTDGSVRGGGIILSGHTDVVPVAGQQWDSDPFTVTERDGKLYGRGTCDMKGFIAVVLALTPTLLATPRDKPVHFAFSADEEVGCRGAIPMLQYMRDNGVDADCCVVGEPTMMEVITGNKGSASYQVIVKGKAAHSSLSLMNTSCNAIEYAADIIAKIREVALDLRENGPRDNAYDCPFCPMSTVLLSGGNAVNTVPETCTFRFGLRILNRGIATSVASIIESYIQSSVVPLMKAEYSDASVTVVNASIHLHFDANEDAPFTQIVRRLRDNYTVRKMGALTEAGYFVNYLSVPTVIVGPGGIDVAHQPNEFVSLEQLSICEDFVKRVVLETTQRTSH